jgi:cytochrome c553
MIKGRTLIISAFAFLPTVGAANSFGNAELGKTKSPSCIFCHGKEGKAVNPSYPNLNGQNAQYLFQSMKDYQQGNRSGALAEMMKAQLSMLDEQDLKDIAAFYSGQTP